MITIDMLEAMTRLSQLVKAVEEEGETVVIKRNGQPVAEIHPYRAKPGQRDLTPDPMLRPILAMDFDPAEPLGAEEWPSELR